ncbi:MAG TPA: GYD domain-containing protein [Chromatiales bacterium]|nr:GYD domain-containing protein [Thiotrichales bacterium]HIP68609.1 GYD domain-containing protein [Chromatiales bacterium]
MSTFVSLLNFTDQGILNIKDSPDRFNAFKAMAEQMGISVKAVYYTVGSYDMVVIVEGDNELAIAALLKTGSLGNIRSQTLLGFSVDDMKQIIGKMP